MKILKGKKQRPRRCMLVGTHGIGKSTWAASAEAPIVLQCEAGLDDIGVDRTELLTSYAEVEGALSYLIKNEHAYQTVVVDTVDWLERLIWTHTAETHGKQSIEEFGYGKGYTFAIKSWQRLLNGLDMVRERRGCAVVLLAHAKVVRHESPDADTYDRYEPDLHKSVSPMLQEWCDEVLFASYKLAVISRDEGFGRQRTRAVGQGERVVYTCERPTHLAKRRIELPDEMPLEWSAYRERWPKAGNVAGIVRDGSSKGAK